MPINSINTNSYQNIDNSKNKKRIKVASVAGSALGIAAGVAGVYAMAKKGNPNIALSNLKYAEKDVLLLGAGSVVGGLIGGSIADNDKSNIKSKIREASNQFVGNMVFPVATLAAANKILDKTGFKLPKINSNSKFAKIANAVLAVVPKAVVTVASLMAGMEVGNRIMDSINNKIFKEESKYSFAPEDMLLHADDICLTANMLLKDVGSISSVTSKALPLTMLISGAKTGMKQKEC